MFGGKGQTRGADGAVRYRNMFEVGMQQLRHLFFVLQRWTFEAGWFPGVFYSLPGINLPVVWVTFPAWGGVEDEIWRT